MKAQHPDVARSVRLTIDGKEQLPTYVVGGTIETDSLGVCRIVAVHPLGTIDVVSKAGKYYRITGLRIA